MSRNGTSSVEGAAIQPPAFRLLPSARQPTAVERESTPAQPRQRIPVTTGAIVVAIAGAVLCGWLLDSATLKRLLPGMAAMQASTALAFILCALGLLHRAEAGPRRPAFRWALAGLLGILAMSILVQRVVGGAEGLEQIMLLGLSQMALAPIEGRMPVAAAVNFLLLAGALVLSDRRRWWWLAQLMVGGAVGLALLAFVGYLYRIPTDVAAGVVRPFAFHSVLLFFLLALGLLTLCPDRGFIAMVRARNVGGWLVRRLLPAALVVPLFLGWLILLGQNAGYLRPSLALALFALANMIVFACLVAWSAAIVNSAARTFNEELEHRVEERTTELAAANRELEAFSYSVSHDLRAPLRAIDGFSRIVVQRYAATLPEEGQRYLDDVRAATQQMGRLIDDLLTFSRLSRQPLRKQLVGTRELVEDCVVDWRAAHPQRDVEIRLGDLGDCQADLAMIKQVWINLLANAFKYTSKRDHAVIEIGSRPGDVPDEQVFFVKDNGVGFDMRYAAKLFGVFQRLHHAEEYEGTGVGLAIVQRIVHRHGGRVWAEAKPDRGATFSFTLP